MKNDNKIDVNQMPLEQVDSLSQQIGNKAVAICERAAKKINSMLAVYGMSAKISIVFDELPQVEEKELKVPKKRGRKSKQDNLKVAR